MINEEKRSVQIYVINSNTGHVVRSERIVTNESLITVAERCATKDSIVVTLMPDVLYCFYINREVYMCTNNKTSIELINFFKDVLCGLYDNARDSFHIEYGRVATICQHVNVADTSIYDVLLKCIDDIWETRYYSRFLRRGKND